MLFVGTLLRDPPTPFCKILNVCLLKNLKNNYIKVRELQTTPYVRTMYDQLFFSQGGDKHFIEKYIYLTFFPNYDVYS